MVMNFCWAATGLLPNAVNAANAKDAASVAGRSPEVERIELLILVLPFVVESLARSTTGVGVHCGERPGQRSLQADDDLVDLVLRHDEGRREQHVVAAPTVNGSAH